MASDLSHAVVTDETELIFAGFAAFLDPPKASARDALARLEASGVNVKTVTGDNELVTQHICGSLGLRIEGASASRLTAPCRPHEDESTDGGRSGGAAHISDEGS